MLPTNNFGKTYVTRTDYILPEGNLSESPRIILNIENILISRFYDQFSRSSRNLGHFGSSKKFQILRT